MKGEKRGFVDFLPVLFLPSILLLLFGKLFLSGAALYGSDFHSQFYPMKDFIRDHLLAQGSLPFWNSFLFSGTPMVSNIQASMFYPPGILYYLLPTELAYGYSTVLHCLSGSLFMFAFMRTIGVTRAGSVFGAVVFSLNGYFMGHLYAGHLTFVQTYIWIPLIFLFLNRFVESRRPAAAVCGGLFLGIQILGGFPQVAFYTLTASFLFVLFHAVIRARSGLQGIRRLGAGFLIFLLIGSSLAAVQLLPTIEFSGLSTRSGGVSYAMATYDSLHPKELLAFLIPEIFGNAVDGTYWRSVETHHFWESCGYVGILPLFLLFTGGKDGISGKIQQFFSFLAVLALFLSLGKYNPLYPLIYKIPGFDSFRIPAQIIFLYVFSVAVLSGLALGRISEERRPFAKSYLFFLAPIFFVVVLSSAGFHLFPAGFFSFLFRHFAEGSMSHADLALLSGRMGLSIDRTALLFALSHVLLTAWRRSRVRTSFFAIAACAVISVDLFLFGHQFVKTFELVTPAEKMDLVERLSKSPVQGRVLTDDRLFSTNDGLQYRFPSVLGYDPLILKRYMEFVLAAQDLPPDEHLVNLRRIGDPRAKLSRLLHVKQVVADGKIMETADHMPYAFIVDDVIVKKPEEIFSFMKSDAFDPVRTVVLEGDPSVSREKGVVDEVAGSSCKVLSHDHEEIRIEASLKGPGYLVISEVFYPGWHASVDGYPTPVLRGNGLFRVVQLHSGVHEVRFHFVSWPFRIGALLSLLSLCFALGFLILKKGTIAPGALPATPPQ
ncbi:MAG: hypothetical protein C4576_19445 [Desulfobacteraceae bacterium]|nr:MAG: hypothetical protein C4576_19445 [Desulfobacteraceae bacterium]